MVELAQAHNIRVVVGTVLPAARYNWRPAIDPVPSIAGLNEWIRKYAVERKITVVELLRWTRWRMRCAARPSPMPPTELCACRMLFKQRRCRGRPHSNSSQPIYE